MKLSDGLSEYRRDQALWSLTVQVEGIAANRILPLLTKYGDDPTQDAQFEARQFLLKVEEWKSFCNRERMINAVQNSPRRIWDALLNATRAKTDEPALAAIMTLHGFGAAPDPETGQHRAKMATAVLRFLWPLRWGVVDWRNAAMSGLIKKCDGDCDRAISRARHQTASELRQIFDIIDLRAAIEMNDGYMRTAKTSRLRF